MQAKRILLAEDNTNDVELILSALDHHHLANEVQVVRDGAEALDYLYRRGKFAGVNEAPPVVVLLDLKMPKVDGLEVLRRVKADAKLKTIPVVVMTSSREEQDLLNTYSIGVNAYVVKPVQFDQFVEVVRQLSLFWVLVNEPPCGTLARGESRL